VSGNGSATSHRLRRLRWAQTYLRGGPVVVTWNLSPCGASACLLCDQESGAEGEWASESACARIVSELSRLGTLVVSLVGGRDPFLHPQLPGIVGHVGRSHLPVLTSSGWGVTAERARDVWDAGLVEAAIVLHSADAAAHDSEVGWPGAHARALNALRTLNETRQHGWQRVNASVPLGPKGAAAVEGVLDLVEGMRAGVVVDLPLRRSALGLTAGLGRDLRELKARRSALRNSAGYLARVDQSLAEGVGGCKAGRRSLHVDQRGRVFRCADLTGSSQLLGDLTSEPSADVLARLRRRADLDGCRECWRTARGELECIGTWRGLWMLSSWLWS